MFEFSLENGKTQFVGGFKCLIAAIIVGIVWSLFSLIPNETAQLVFMIIFVIVMGVLVILSSIKLIFGAVVYHAERTAGKQAKPIQQNKKS